MWETVNNLAGRTKSGQSHTALTASENIKLVDDMNRHFIKAGAYPPGAESNRKDGVVIREVSETIFLRPTDPIEVVEVIRKLKRNVAAGIDEITANVIIHVAHEISEVLAYLLNLTLSDGIFPEELKIARVTPIHKGGDKGQFSNYRPISILTVFSKIYEHVIYDRLVTFFNTHKVITKSQYGFQKNKSTEQALLYIKDKIIKNIEDKNYTLGLFLDLKKAFDSIDHKILLRKLEKYGIRGVANRLLESYLNNRQQFVRMQDVSSSYLTLEQGVPQGSKLGPLLFIIFVNDIVNIPDSPELIMYADDTNLFFKSQDLNELEHSVNHYLVSLACWMNQNKLQLNAEKTKYIIFRSRNTFIDKEVTITYAGRKLQQVTNQKFLGVTFNEELSWNAHISQLCTDLSKSIGIMYRISKLVPLWLKQQLYNCLFYSKLCYGALVWGTTTKTNYKKLVLLQKRVLRLYCNHQGNYANLRTAPLFKRHHMLRADQVFYMKILQIIYREKLYQHNEETRQHTYPIRQRLRRPQRTRTNYGKLTFTYQTTCILNKLEHKLNFHCTEKTFKVHVKEVLMQENIRFDGS